ELFPLLRGDGFLLAREAGGLPDVVRAGKPGDAHRRPEHPRDRAERATETATRLLVRIEAALLHHGFRGRARHGNRLARTVVLPVRMAEAPRPAAASRVHSLFLAGLRSGQPAAAAEPALRFDSRTARAGPALA